MFGSFYHWLKQRSSDWLIAIVMVIFLIIFAITQPVWQSKESLGLPSVSPDMLKKHVRFISESLPPRDSDAENLAKTAQYLHEQWSEFGQPHYQTYDALGGTFNNVILDFGQDNPKKELLVIGAHYDSAEGFAGADDNASSLAVLIELARILSNAKLSNPVQLVAYALMEPPFFGSTEMGSYVHANQLYEQHRQLKLMIALEMVGYYSEQPDSQAYPWGILSWLYPNRGNFVLLAGRLDEMLINRQLKKSMRKASALKVRSINAPRLLPGLDFSDHRNYWAMDFPAVMLTDTAFYRNKAYHTQQDRYQRLNYKNMAYLTQGLYQIVMDYDEK